MKLTLKEAMRSAEDGCLIDKEEITRVLQNLLGTPAKEFPARYITDLKEMLACGLEWIGEVSNEEFGEYTYLDLICLAELTAQTIIRNDNSANFCLILLSDQVFQTFLRRAEDYCTPVDLFLAVNLKALMEILDELAGEPQTGFSELIKLTQRINSDTVRFDLTPKSTVKDLINQTERVIKQNWYPWHNLNDFRSDVLIGYGVSYMIAFECIENAFGDTFRKWEKEVEKRTNR